MGLEALQGMQSPDISGGAVSPTIGKLPGDYQNQLDAAQQKQLLAKFLLQRFSTQPQGQMVSGHYVAPSPLAGIAQALGTYVGLKQYGEGNKEVSAVRDRYNTDVQGERAKVLGMLTPQTNTTSGVPSFDAAKMTRGLDEETLPMQTSTTPADPMGAERAAMGSKFPEVQKLAEALQKQRMDLFKAAAPGATNTSLVSAAQGGGNIGGLAPAVASPVVPVQLGENAGAQWSDTKGNPHFSFAPKGTVVNNNLGDKVEHGLVSKDVADRATALKKSIPDTVSSVNNMFSALDRGTYTGAASQVNTAIGKIGSLLGVPDIKAANSEEFKQQVAPLLMANAKSLGAGSGFSNTDRDFLEKALPNLMAEPENIPKVMSILGAGKLNEALRHNADLDSAASAGLISPQMAQYQRVDVPNTIPGVGFDNETKQYVAVPYSVWKAAKKGAPFNMTEEQANAMTRAMVSNGGVRNQPPGVPAAGKNVREFVWGQ